MVESAWVKDMRHLLQRLDPNKGKKREDLNVYV